MAPWGLDSIKNYILCVKWDRRRQDRICVFLWFSVSSVRLLEPGQDFGRSALSAILALVLQRLVEESITTSTSQQNQAFIGSSFSHAKVYLRWIENIWVGGQKNKNRVACYVHEYRFCLFWFVSDYQSTDIAVSVRLGKKKASVSRQRRDRLAAVRAVA